MKREKGNEIILESGHELYSDTRQMDGETQPAPPERADFSLGLPGEPGEPADPGSSRCDKRVSENGSNQAAEQGVCQG